MPARRRSLAITVEHHRDIADEHSSRREHLQTVITDHHEPIALDLAQPFELRLESIGEPNRMGCLDLVETHIKVAHELHDDVGSFKKLTLLADGREQVTGFHVAGESLGADGIAAAHYASDAIALEDSSVCVMPFDLLELLSREVKAVQHHVFRMLSAQLVRESNATMLLGTMTADERVAAFLLDLSHRWQARSYSPSVFVLRMTREETGSNLGLKLETVSRTLSRFQKQGLIQVDGKEVRILDFAGLIAVTRHPA
jgi:CRP/FNR family transcriptional regulator